MKAYKIYTNDGRRFYAYGNTESEAMKQAKEMARGSNIWKVEAE